MIVGAVLSTRLPVKILFALFAVFPVVVGVGVLFLGLTQRRQVLKGDAAAVPELLYAETANAK